MNTIENGDDRAPPLTTPADPSARAEEPMPAETRSESPVEQASNRPAPPRPEQTTNNADRPSHRGASMQEQFEGFDTAFVDALDTRMGQAQLRENGWRDRDDIDDIMRNLERLAGSDWQVAAKLWDKHVPGEIDKPVFIDGDDIEPEAKDKPEKDGKLVTPESLKKRYLIADNKFYFREEATKLAFEDHGKRLATDHDDPAIARSMVELAEAKAWQTIRVKGSDDFKREVWLAASLRGMDVQGYRPTDVDRARLEELMQDRPARPRNTIEQGQDRDHQLPRTSKAAEPENKPPAADDGERALSPQQRTAIDTLRNIMKSRGDSTKAIDMATEIAKEKLQQDRVYIGTVQAYGHAPYQGKVENEQSFYVTLKTAHGERTVWGVDLERTLTEKNVDIGAPVVLAREGAVPVVVKTKEKDADDMPTGRTTALPAHRNAWQVSRVDVLRDEVLAKLQRKEARSNAQPSVPVYDSKAPRRENIREPAAPDRDRSPQPQPQR